MTVVTPSVTGNPDIVNACLSGRKWKMHMPTDLAGAVVSRQKMYASQRIQREIVPLYLC